jgi:hypothetical protein
MGVDNDINLDPFLFLWTPSKKDDQWARKYQHLYFFPLLSFLCFNLRLQSFMIVWRKRDPIEMMISVTAYSWLIFCMPGWVAFCACWLSGLLVGVITSVVHQSGMIYVFRSNACVLSLLHCMAY